VPDQTDELYPRHPVITTDVGDFRIYRRGRREAIPHSPAQAVATALAPREPARPPPNPACGGS
jgi:hypothetical protein